MCSREATAGGGRLVDRPFLHSLLLLCASLHNSTLVDLDRGGGDMGTRGSPGQQP